MIRRLYAILLPLAVVACATRPAPASSQEASGEVAFEMPAGGGTLHGTLLLPAGSAPSPVALIIAGSGPTDRNGNSPLLPGQNNSLRLLAEGLAQQGIATLRYDKRGIAESAYPGLREADLRFNTYVGDAVALLSRLRGDARFSRVSIVGHSEGALIAVMAAQRVDVDAIVSIAGAGRPAVDVLREQLRPQLPADLWTESERVLNSLVEGRTADGVPEALNALYRPSVQPYLISYLPLDPAAEIARTSVPVLIVHGETDVQVSVADAHALHAARPDATLAIIEGMNHILKLVPADMARQQASYSDPALPVAPELLEAVGSFLLDPRSEGP